jgi:hypothetical protein
MFTTIFTYLLIGIIGLLIYKFGLLVVSLTIFIPLISIGLPRFVITFLTGLISAFLTVWIGNLVFDWVSLIFDWFIIPSGTLILVILGFELIIGKLKRIIIDGEMEEFGQLVGDISGIILGGYFLIFQ